MYASYNACGSSDQGVNFIFDSSTLHTFHTRDVSTVSASSFIIVITVGFVGLLMICAGSSSYYRRRLARNNLALPESQRNASINWKITPQLWDVSVEKWMGQRSGGVGQWGSMQPLAMRLLADRGETLDNSPPRGRRRDGRRWGRRMHRDQQAPGKTPVTSDSVQEADVVVLVAMPGSPSVPPSLHAVDHKVVGGNASPTEKPSWAEYVVGVAQVPLHGDGAKTFI